jgi:hypothetical protein
MSALFVNNHAEPFHLEFTALAPCVLRDKEESALQIACHIRQLLETYGTGHPVTLKIPSCMALAEFYNRSPLDVLDALFCLKEQQFTYRMNGLDGEITLYDPIGRRNNHDVACGWAFKPHELPHRDATEHQDYKKHVFGSLFKHEDD